MPRLVDEAIDYLTERDRHFMPIVSIMALMGLGKVARLASLGLAALWIADQIRHIDRDRTGTTSDRMIDTAAEDSFPASDAPSYSGTTAGAPEGEEKTFRIVH